MLHNSKSTFELFNIRTEADYRLVYELRRIRDNLRVQDNARELFVKINDTVSVYNDELYIRIYNSGRELFRIKTSLFVKTPSIVFEGLRKYIT